MPFLHLQNQAEPIKANSVYCIGRNYAEHAKELNNPIPTKPMVFLKPNASLELVDGSMILPKESNDVHHEVELVLLIGKKGKSISVENAWDYISGFGVGIDFTARDIQQKAKEKGHPWTLAKGFDTFGPVSSFVPKNQFDLSEPFLIRLELNDELQQEGSSSDMIFSIPELVAYVSSFATLYEGDIIFTGTPEGVSKVNHGDTLIASLQGNKAVLQVSVR